MWIINKSSLFEKWIDKETVSKDIFPFLLKSLSDFRREPTNRTKTLFRDGFYEIWDIHIPDKDGKNGKSGGFRVMIRLNNDTKIMVLEVIIRRQHLDWKDCSGKHQSAWYSHLKEFKIDKDL